MSCCVVLQDGLVFWHSNGSVNVVAWGAWERDRQERSRICRRAAQVPPPGPDADGEPFSSSPSSSSSSDNGSEEEEESFGQNEEAFNLYTVRNFDELNDAAIRALRRRAMSRTTYGHVRGAYECFMNEVKAETEEHFWLTYKELLEQEFLQVENEVHPPGSPVLVEVAGDTSVKVAKTYSSASDTHPTLPVINEKEPPRKRPARKSISKSKTSTSGNQPSSPPIAEMVHPRATQASKLV
jgi:hypothetical protein